MPTGPEMLMKALGINPEEIKAAITDTINGIRGGLEQLDKRLKAIEQQNAENNLLLLQIQASLNGTEESATHSNGLITQSTMEGVHDEN